MILTDFQRCNGHLEEGHIFKGLFKGLKLVKLSEKLQEKDEIK